jgi:kynurenine formamidase
MDVSSLLATLGECRVYDLEQPRRQGDPVFPAHAPGFLYWLHRRHEPDLGEARTSASGTLVMAEHSGTHIDALCHQAEDLVMHGGLHVSPRIQTSKGFTRLDAASMAPIICRGVVLDVAEAHGGEALPSGYAVTPEDLEDAARQGSQAIRPGDAVLVRTGNGARYSDAPSYENGPGISVEASQWLADQRVGLVGCDNLAWDLPGPQTASGETLPGHVVLLVRAGILIVENLFLEELAAAAREFLFWCAPLKLVGATGSPVRPLALVPQD